jgi:hypothetical protein
MLRSPVIKSRLSQFMGKAFTLFTEMQGKK